MQGSTNARIQRKDSGDNWRRKRDRSCAWPHDLGSEGMNLVIADIEQSALDCAVAGFEAERRAACWAYAPMLPTMIQSRRLPRLPVSFLRRCSRPVQQRRGSLVEGRYWNQTTLGSGTGCSALI